MAERNNRNVVVVVEEGNNTIVVVVVERNNRNVVAVVVMEGDNRNVVMEVERKLQKCDSGGKTIEMWHEAVLKKKVESMVDMRSIFLWMENV